MTRESNEKLPPSEKQMQRLNTLARAAGMTALFFFLATLLGVFIFPPSSPAKTGTLLPPTLTPTATLTPTSPPPTPTPLPRVELLSIDYLQVNLGCQVDVLVNVNGDALTGVFHVWNASYDDPAGRVSEPEALPPGLSSGYLLTLEGGQPEFPEYEVWFEYEDGLSNRLPNLVCPAWTTPTP